MQSSGGINTLKVLLQKEFSLFIATRFILIFSLFLQNTVVSYKLYSLTKNPLSLGLVGLFEVIPAFACAFFAGYVVDRKEKRSVYLLCILGYILNAILFLYITSTSFTHQYSVSAMERFIYMGMFISGFIRAFLAPSSFSLLPLLVKKEDIPFAITWSSTSWMLGSVLGPLVGGILLAHYGISISIAFALVLLCVSSFFILAIKRKPIQYSKDIGIIKGLAQGFRFVFRNQLILAVLSLDLFAVLFGGAEALLPVVSTDILQVGEVGYGWLRSAHGIGAIFLLLVLTYIPLKNHVGKKLFLCVGLFGLCILFFGLSTSFILSFFLLFFAGLFDGVSVVIRHSILQMKTPEHLKGRVSSINMMFISSSNELGAFESGFTARYLGTVPAIVLGGFMTIAVVISTYFLAPQLKNLNAMEDEPVNDA
ncbi:MAG: MFS transporter [Bacteroidetes bacterium]|jgi:MFS family permease|nr:MFS transporter [Bacteroidota bacterium]HQW47517.1 MFS transporter [Chitinophagaceae bacterium]MBK7040592.1 MFS transporter [Bacteroidota bacterium]MBK8328414.1 MFS transporter [Bacteroidota bacterium]MBK9300361.1 MFS transporter [Bacteroidota bacterium]